MIGWGTGSFMLGDLLVECSCRVGVAFEWQVVGAELYFQGVQVAAADVHSYHWLVGCFGLGADFGYSVGGVGGVFVLEVEEGFVAAAGEIVNGFVFGYTVFAGVLKIGVEGFVEGVGCSTRRDDEVVGYVWAGKDMRGWRRSAGLFRWGLEEGCVAAVWPVGVVEEEGAAFLLG